MLSFDQVSVRRDGKLLFSDFSAVVHAGQKIGVTGRNGSGKSTLFAMILGEVEPDSGTVRLQRRLKLSHVAQETEGSERNALDFVIDGDTTLRALETALLSPETGNDGVQHAALLADFEQAGGYHAHARAGALLNGLGFPIEQHQWPVKRFSGGWRMRLNLAQALMCPSDLLLLDEPTNHLDLDAVLWLESWLVQRTGALLLISHDREFLDRITTHTLHIEQGRLTLWSGNYSAFERLRASRLAHQQSLYDRQEQKRVAMQAFVARFRAKATKARQAQSRLKMLEKLTEQAPARADSPFQFSFQPPDALPNPLVVIEHASVGYAGVAVLDTVAVSLQCGQRVGLLGANGAGKTTLIKALVGELPLIAGSRTAATRLQIGYFAQHTVDQLCDDHSALQALQTLDPALREPEARRWLGGYGFEAERALQRADTLSGGERARLALSLVVYQRPNLLVLDEPTNHLDIGMRQALAEALQAYTGALVLVSHDRGLLGSVTDEFWLIADGRMHPFDDDLDGYARWLSVRRAVTGPTPESRAQSRGRPATAQSVGDRHRRRIRAAERSQLAPLKRAVSEAERQLDGCEAELAELRDRLSANELYNEANRAELTGLLKREAELKERLASVEDVVLMRMHALEQAQLDVRNDYGSVADVNPEHRSSRGR